MNSPTRLVARDDLAPADDQHAEETEAGHDVDQARQHRPARHHLGLAGDDVVGQRPEASELIGFQQVELDRRDAVKDLVQPGRQRRVLLPHLARLAPDVALQEHHRQDQERRARQRHQRPAPVDRQRHDHQRDQRHGVASHTVDQHPPDGLHGEGVVAEIAHQLARRVAGVEPAVDGHQVVEQVDLQLAHRALADPRDDDPVGDTGDGPDAEECEDRAADPPDRAGLAAHEDPVEHRLEHVAQDAERRAFDGHQDEAHDHPEPVAPQVVAPEPGGQSRDAGVGFGHVRQAGSDLAGSVSGVYRGPLRLASGGPIDDGGNATYPSWSQIHGDTRDEPRPRPHLPCHPRPVGGARPGAERDAPGIAQHLYRRAGGDDAGDRWPT